MRAKKVKRLMMAELKRLELIKPEMIQPQSVIVDRSAQYLITSLTTDWLPWLAKRLKNAADEGDTVQYLT